MALADHQHVTSTPLMLLTRASCSRIKASDKKLGLFSLGTEKRRRISTEHVSQKLSAPADSVDRTATVHRSSSPNPYARRADARSRYRTRYGPRPQHDPGSSDATGRITDILAVNHGAGLFRARGEEHRNT
jgi:hypothetical protein